MSEMGSGSFGRGVICNDAGGICDTRAHGMKEADLDPGDVSLFDHRLDDVRKRERIALDMEPKSVEIAVSKSAIGGIVAGCFGCPGVDGPVASGFGERKAREFHVVIPLN